MCFDQPDAGLGNARSHQRTVGVIGGRAPVHDAEQSAVPSCRRYRGRPLGQRWKAGAKSAHPLMESRVMVLLRSSSRVGFSTGSGKANRGGDLSMVQKQPSIKNAIRSLRRGGTSPCPRSLHFFDAQYVNGQTWFSGSVRRYSTHCRAGTLCQADEVFTTERPWLPRLRHRRNSSRS